VIRYVFIVPMRNEDGRFWSVEHLDDRGQVPDARTTWSSTWVVDTRVVKGDRPPPTVVCSRLHPRPSLQGNIC
jgi:hypothetical protein